MYSVCTDCEYTLIRFSFFFKVWPVCCCCLRFFFSSHSSRMYASFVLYSQCIPHLIFSYFLHLCLCSLFLSVSVAVICIVCNNTLYSTVCGECFSCSAGAASHLALLLLLSFGILFISLVYRCFVRSDSISFLIDMCMILRFPKFTLYITGTTPHSTTVLLRIGFTGVFFSTSFCMAHTNTKKN